MGILRRANGDAVQHKLGSVTDSAVLSAEADRVILVARSGGPPKPPWRATELLMQMNARVMGEVLNAFNLRSADG